VQLNFVHSFKCLKDTLMVLECIMNVVVECGCMRYLYISRTYYSLFEYVGV
jgi:hypothetical protein